MFGWLIRWRAKNDPASFVYFDGRRTRRVNMMEAWNSLGAEGQLELLETPQGLASVNPGGGLAEGLRAIVESANALQRIDEAGTRMLGLHVRDGDRPGLSFIERMKIILAFLGKFKMHCRTNDL